MPLGLAWLLTGAVDADSLPELFDPLAVHLEGLQLRRSDLGWTLLALFLIHLLGLVDDRRPLGPWTKLLGQLLIAGGLVGLTDTRILTLLGESWGAAGTVISLALSILWLIAITNALNFLDNMNGLSAGVGAIIAGCFLAATLLTPGISGQWFDAALAALLAGALLGFLPLNYPRARLFLGDGGSLVIGLLLAVLSVRVTYFDVTGAMGSVRWYSLLTPLVLLAVPLYDLVSVCVARLAAGRSPMQADQNHLSHRLVRRGLSPAVAVLAIWLCTLATAIQGVLLPSLMASQAVIVALGTLSILTLLALLETGGREAASSA